MHHTSTLLDRVESRLDGGLRWVKKTQSRGDSVCLLGGIGEDYLNSHYGRHNGVVYRPWGDELFRHEVVQRDKTHRMAIRCLNYAIRKHNWWVWFTGNLTSFLLIFSRVSNDYTRRAWVVAWFNDSDNTTYHDVRVVLKIAKERAMKLESKETHAALSKTADFERRLALVTQNEKEKVDA